MGKAMNAGRAKRWSKLAAVPVGVLASGVIVLGATHATVTASTWNEGNTLESGKWTKAEVTSDKPNQAVVKATGLVPGGAAQWANVRYTFKSDGSDDEQSGRVVLKGITATDSAGQTLSSAQTSELAKYLHLGFKIESPNGLIGEFEKTQTVADWAKATEINGFKELRGFDLSRDQSKNELDVKVGWNLGKDAPAEAQNSKITFILGAEVDDEPTDPTGSLPTPAEG